MTESDNTRWERMADSDVEQLVADGVNAIDAPPSHVGSAARAAFELHGLDDQLVRLLADDAAVVRDEDADRADLSFETDLGNGSVSVVRVTGGWRVTGTAPGSSTVTVAGTGGAQANVEVDDVGFFEHTLRTGVGEAVRVVVGDRFVTPWMP